MKPVYSKYLKGNEKEIGHGGFSQVFEAELDVGGTKYSVAVKRIPIDGMSNLTGLSQETYNRHLTENQRRQDKFIEEGIFTKRMKKMANNKSTNILPSLAYIRLVLKVTKQKLF